MNHRVPKKAHDYCVESKCNRIKTFDENLRGKNVIKRKNIRKFNKPIKII